MPNRKSVNKTQSVDKLIKENATLKSELAKLKSQQKTPKKPFNWRRLFKTLSLALAGAVFIVGSVVLYLAMSLVDTSRFMKIAGPLARQPAVQTVVADKTTSALFSKFDVEQFATDILPPKADFLAPAISDKAQELTNTQLKVVLGSESFHQTWENSIEKAHQKFITGLENYEGNGTININDVYLRLSERLQDTKLKFLANRELPPKIGEITLITASWLPTAHNLVSNISLYRYGTIAIFIALLALTIWISKNRRQTIKQLGIMITLLSVALIISLRIFRTLAENNAKPENQAAVAEIGQLFTRPFIIQLVTTAIIGLAVFFVAWVGSQSKTAINLRKRIDNLFAGKLHQSLFKKENGFTLWVGKNQKILLSLLGIGFIISLLFITFTWTNFIIDTIIALIIAFIIVTVSGRSDT